MKYLQKRWKSFNPLFIRSVFLLSGLHIVTAKIRDKFQSLIHQVSVSFSASWNQRNQCRGKFQSLIHQVSVSFMLSTYIILVLMSMFQSLIHQVSVSFQGRFLQLIKYFLIGFNPLFIRSVFLFRFAQNQMYVNTAKFQSLIHQVSVSFRQDLFRRGASPLCVSIPYSSGQCFFCREGLFWWG